MNKDLIIKKVLTAHTRRPPLPPKAAVFSYLPLPISFDRLQTPSTSSMERS